MPAVMVLLEGLTADGQCYRKGEVVENPGNQLTHVAAELDQGRLHFKGAVAKFVSPMEVQSFTELDMVDPRERKMRELAAELQKLEEERQAAKRILTPKPPKLVLPQSAEDDPEVVPAPASAVEQPPAPPDTAEPIPAPTKKK